MRAPPYPHPPRLHPIPSLPLLPFAQKMFWLHFSLSSACVITFSHPAGKQAWLGLACFLLSFGESLGSYVGPRPLLQSNWFSHANALLVRTLVFFALSLCHRKEHWSGNSDLCVYLCSFRWAQDGHARKDGKQANLKGNTASGWDLVDLMQTGQCFVWMLTVFLKKKKKILYHTLDRRPNLVNSVIIFCPQGWY